MCSLKQTRLYSDLAYLWPIISPPEEYREEAGYWRQALWVKLGFGKHQILELGVGGGHNHRFNRGDGVLIKDNHLAAARARGLTVAQVIEQARRAVPHTLRVEIEVTSAAEAREALDAGADIVLLDNMSLAEMREASAAAKGRELTEASGGVTLESVRAVAETGVDIISVGALTHSAAALDMSLEVEGG